MNQRSNKRATLPTKRIAVIEDDTTVRDLIEDFIQDEGYEYDAFASPEEFKNSDINSFDIIITDIMLQDKRSAGVDMLVEFIDNCMDPQKTKIIFISNFGRESIQTQLGKLERYGCKFEWLAKPFSMLDLYERICFGER